MLNRISCKNTTKALRGFLFIATVSLFLLALVSCSDSDSGSELAGGVTEGTNALDTVYVYDTLTHVDTIENLDTITVVDTIVKPTDSVEVYDIALKGVVQKGPLVNGSAITVLELDSSFRQTGLAFRGKTDAKGSFSVNSVGLKSPYAIVEATGFYMNEVTGAKSNSMISLYAFVDFSKQKVANVNIMTHLEYDRINYLVHEKNMSIIDAKKQADAEMAAQFFMADADFDATNATIFGSTPADGMLLAVSVLVSGNHSDAEISEMLAAIAEDFSEDGSIDDPNLLIELADFAQSMDPEMIRRNVKAWKIADSVAPFEKSVATIKNSIYGLGECNEKNKGSVKQNANELSSFAFTNFKCDGENWNVIYYNPEIEYGTLKDERDGNEYRTVKIGDKTWMAENLRYHADGYKCYDDNPHNCDDYGVLYTFVAAEKACPAGSHLPSIDEWRELFVAVGGADSAAKKLRAHGAWNSLLYPQTEDDKDEFGFSSRPSGVYLYGGFGEVGWYMSSTIVTGLDKEGNLVQLEGEYDVAIGSGDGVSEDAARFSTAIAVRCVLD